ncbi:MAG: hypothetical protein G01um101433_978 [Parcubacteria group bacterium Gr01-1014_33]|nr:MAG: hypothetical protein G01um101433_978 [Parcubacteria group bacterium Gr01-1014_33]
MSKESIDKPFFLNGNGSNGSVDNRKRKDTVEIIRPSIVPTVSLTFTHDRWAKGWTLLKDTPLRKGETLSTEWEVVHFLKERELYINGEELIKRAYELGAVYGQRHAEGLLEHPEFIPAGADDFYLLFVGTVLGLCDMVSDCVPYLHIFRSEWFMHLCWLGTGFNSDYRLLRPRNIALPKQNGNGRRIPWRT